MSVQPEGGSHKHRGYFPVYYGLTICSLGTMASLTRYKTEQGVQAIH